MSPSTQTSNALLDSCETPSNAIFDRNINAIALRAPRLAKAIAAALPATDIEFIESSEAGALTAIYQGATLASRRRPITEAERLASTVDLTEVGAVVVMGFGLGHHVEALARAARGAALIVVFEPDLPLLRAVLERIDYAGVLTASNVSICTESNDLGALTEAIHGSEALVAMGVRFIEHPASAARLGESAGVFSQSVANIVGTVRSQIITTMVQSEMALRNALMNAPHYVNGLGIADLKDAATGHAAIVVAAGPSLRRNMHLLRDPKVRKRCIIIAAQTVLKPLLAEGIKPHFVTALDYHEISARFYEGLTEHDLEGVTLVVEAKANPAILDAYPGVIRCVGDDILDKVLGETSATVHGKLKPGATVAHLSCYLARHLGCDPVILTGQDLGFTDGQYYCDGASIHRVWACELNPFRTLEMFEWERIVRSKSILRKVTDHLERPIYTDEQMAAYLTQFEHDFLTDSANNLTIIDATEGGVRKAHTSPMPLAAAIALHVSASPDLPALFSELPDRHNPKADIGQLNQRLLALRQETVRLGNTTRRSGDVLDEIKANLGDTNKANSLIEHVHKLGVQAQSNQPAYDIVQRINQTGAFNRIRTDRALRIEDDLDPKEVQRRRLERDRTNLRWFADAADSFAQILEKTAIAHERGALRTRIASVDPTTIETPAKTTRIRCVALIDASAGDRAMLDRTIERLACCNELDGVEVIGKDHPSRTTRGADRLSAINAARRFSPACWRGGLAGLTCYDECFDPSVLASAMNEHNADAALLVGADWSLVDPELCDEVIRRHRENPTDHRLTFTQAPPGLAGAVIARSLVEELRDAPENAGAFASIGGLLGYLPMRPIADRIAKPVCVTINALVRDNLGRFIADTPHRRELLDQLIESFGADWPNIPIERLTQSLGAMPELHADTFPAHTILSAARATEIINWLVAANITRPDAALTLECPPLESINDIIESARRAGFASIHVRTALDTTPGDTERLLRAAPDIISIDMLATTSETHRELTGNDRFDRVIENTEYLLDNRKNTGGIPTPWIVPRITRRDAVYEQIEPFYDYWICRAGAAVIDPLPSPIKDDRIAPLTTPDIAADFAARTTQRINPSNA